MVKTAYSIFHMSRQSTMFESIMARNSLVSQNHVQSSWPHGESQPFFIDKKRKQIFE